MNVAKSGWIMLRRLMLGQHFFFFAIIQMVIYIFYNGRGIDVSDFVDKINLLYGLFAFLEIFCDFFFFLLFLFP